MELNLRGAQMGKLLDVVVERDRKSGKKGKDSFIGRTWDGKSVFFTRHQQPRRYSIANRDETTKQIVTVKIVSQKENHLVGALVKSRLQSYISWGEFDLDIIPSMIIESDNLGHLMRGSGGSIPYPALAFAFWSEMRDPTTGRVGGRKPRSLIYHAIREAGNVAPHLSLVRGEYNNIPSTITATITYDGKQVWKQDFTNPLIASDDEFDSTIVQLEELAKELALKFEKNATVIETTPTEKDVVEAVAEKSQDTTTNKDTDTIGNSANVENSTFGDVQIFNVKMTKESTSNGQHHI